MHLHIKIIMQKIKYYLKEKDHTDRVWDSIAMKATEISCVSIDEIQKLLILTTLTEMLKVIK